MFPHGFGGRAWIPFNEYFCEILVAMRGAGRSRFGGAKPGGGEYVVFLDCIAQRLTFGAFGDPMMELFMQA